MSQPPSANRHSSATDHTGRTLGNYQLLRRLGRGGMSTVYLALQTSLDRQVAFKVLHPNLASDDQYLQRFHNEARAVASLAHVNIVQVYEVGCDQGVHFITQEYVRGATLQDYIKRYRSLRPAQAVNVMRQVAAALSHAASRGIVHRDIKPDNILISRDGVVKVADFGLARQSQKPASSHTEAGVALGTPYYMSPEQIQGESLDTRSDLYSLGITSYQMLTGRLPFEGETAYSVAAQHLHAEASPVTEQRQDIPEVLAEIVHRLMAKRKEQRFAGGRELLEALEPLRNSLTTVRLPALPETAFSEDTPEWSGYPLAETQQLQQQLQRKGLAHTPWLFVGVGLFVASLLGVTAGLATRPRPLLRNASQPASPSDGIPRQQSVLRQYSFAMLEDSDAAWRAVPYYFPPEANAQNQRYARLSQMQLVRRYERDRSWDKLLETSRQLAESTNHESRALGLAGQVLAHAANERMEQAAPLLTRLTPFEDALPTEIRREIDRIRRLHGD